MPTEPLRPSSASCESTIPGGLEITVADERIVLLPQKALWWPARRTLFVADLHIGKAATFRTHGIPLGDETQEADLNRLSEAVSVTGSEKLVILGDLLHARRGRSPRSLELVTNWRRQHSELRIDLVEGNHDRAAGPPLEAWQMAILPEGFREGPFVLHHFPESAPDGFVLAGHLHPKVVLATGGGGLVKLPCFWVRPTLAVLPAFGSLIDSAAVKPTSGDCVYPVGDGAVHELMVPSTRRN